MTTRMPLTVLVVVVSSFFSGAAVIPVPASVGDFHRGSASMAAATSRPSGAATRSVSDPTPPAGPLVRLVGEALVAFGERTEQPGASSAVGSFAEHKFVEIRTQRGDLVPISGDIPAGIATGDHFAGTVGIPETLLPHLDDSSRTVFNTAPDGSTLPSTSSTALDIASTADSLNIGLQVATATVVTPTAPTAVPAAHDLKVAIVSTPGVTGTWYSDDQVQALADSSTRYWTDSSRGRITKFSTSQIIRYTSALPCDTDPFQRWDEALQELGLGDSTSYLDNEHDQHVAVVLPSECIAAGVAGVGTVASAFDDAGLSEIFVGAGVDHISLMHELGHNFGLGHSNLDICTKDSTALGCDEYEYADQYDVMGAANQGYDYPTPLNVGDQYFLGFLGDADLPELKVPEGQSSQSFRVQIDADTGAAQQGGAIGYRVVDPISGQTDFIDYRAGALSTQTPFYSDRDPIVPVGPVDVMFTPGVRLTRSTSDNGSSAFTEADPSASLANPSVYVSAAREQDHNTISSPTGSIRVTFAQGDPGSGAVVDVELQGVPPAAPSPVVRFWSPKNSTHFYTISAGERQIIDTKYPSSIWTDEGPRFDAYPTQQPGTIPLYRFWSPRLQGHFFTASESEMQFVRDNYPASTWTFENIAFYVYPLETTVPDTLLVSRFWSPTNQHHFYTSSPQERGLVMTSYPPSTWTYEGERFRVPAW